MRGRMLLVALVNAMLVSTLARAAPEWVDRRIVMSGEPVAGSVDIGLGVGHWEAAPFSANAIGVRAEAALGILSRVDIGAGFGLRSDGGWLGNAYLSQPDSYARLFDSSAPELFLRGSDTASNPEIKVRGKLIDLGVFELGLEGRTYLPFAPETYFNVAFGVPMAVHAGHLLKVDFGVYNVVAYSPTWRYGTLYVLEAPANFWFQATNKVFLGPMTGLRVYSSNWPTNPHFDFILGFGLGVHLAKFIDLKTQLVLPRVNRGLEFLGAGVGLGFVFE